jgi:3-hydroxyacyl-CoA dehydrogenase
MFWADSIGLAEIADKIAEYSESLGGRHWEPSTLLRRLADEGGKLQTFSN